MEKRAATVLWKWLYQVWSDTVLKQRRCVPVGIFILRQVPSNV